MTVQLNTSKRRAPMHPMREAYLRSLPEAQELYLELQIADGEVVDICVKGEAVGYAVTKQGVLLEYYLAPHAVTRSDEVFDALIRRRGIEKAYIKSFDALAVSAAARHHRKLTVAGYLYRDRVRRPDMPLPEWVTPRRAARGDADAVAAINEGVFEKREEIDDYIAKNQIILFQGDDTLLGVAILARVIPGRPEFDVGMLTAVPYRRRGLGAA